MLLLAILLLLLAAVGLVVAALVTGQIVLAWGSVGASAVVAVALLALRRRARRRRREAAEADRDSVLEDEEQDDALVDPQLGHTSVQPPEPSPTAAAEEPDSATQGSDEPRDQPVPADATASGAAAEPDESAAAESAPPEEDPATEPDEEDTDAADLLVVWELPDEVLVVDEHPRYHLARCAWPDPAPTERLPVREARELGFTPCAQCRPDASLARRLRVASAKQEAGSQPQV